MLTCHLADTNWVDYAVSLNKRFANSCSLEVQLHKEVAILELQAALVAGRRSVHFKAFGLRLAEVLAGLLGLTL